MKIQSPWMGRIKGSAGNMTGCKVYDKNVMRAKAFEVNNPNTAAQQVQRGYFADLTKLVASFTPDQLRTLFPSKPKAMSRRNALAKQLAEYNEMEGTIKLIDFAHIDTLGNAPTGQLPTIEITMEGNAISVAWQTNQVNVENYMNNYIVLCIVNTSKEDLIVANPTATMNEGAAEVSAPNNWESSDTLEGFMLVTNSTEAVTGFGSFIIKVRPEKKSH